MATSTSENKTPPITDEDIAKLDPDGMTPDQRITFINDARFRRQAGETLTADHLRFAVRCMRSERKASVANAGAKKTTTAPAKALSLDSF